MENKIELNDLIELYVCDLCTEEEKATVENAMKQDKVLADKVNRMLLDIAAARFEIEESEPDSDVDAFFERIVDKFEEKVATEHKEATERAKKAKQNTGQDTEPKGVIMYFKEKPKEQRPNPFITQKETNTPYSMAALTEESFLARLWNKIKRHKKMVILLALAILIAVACVIIGIKIGNSKTSDEVDTSVTYGTYQTEIPSEWNVKDGDLIIKWTVSDPATLAPWQELTYKTTTKEGTLIKQDTKTVDGSNQFTIPAADLADSDEIELWLKVGYGNKNYETVIWPTTLKIVH